jgi:SSS family solute:Na+ symporter
VALIVLSVFPVIIGMGARALGGTDDPSQSVPWVLQNLVNPLLGGIILAAILAAIMSSADSLLTSATSHVVKDLWIETLHRGREFDEQRMLRLSRAVTIVVGAAALVVGLVGPGIVTILIYSYTLYTAGVFVPVMGGLLWKRGSAAAALSALVIGSAVAIVGIATEFDIAGAPVEVVAAMISGVVFVVVSLVRPEPEQR